MLHRQRAIVQFPVWGGAPCPTDLREVAACALPAPPSNCTSSMECEQGECGDASPCGLCGDGAACGTSRDCTAGLGCSVVGTCLQQPASTSQSVAYVEMNVTVVGMVAASFAAAPCAEVFSQAVAHSLVQQGVLVNASAVNVLAVTDVTVHSPCTVDVRTLCLCWALDVGHRPRLPCVAGDQWARGLHQLRHSDRFHRSCGIPQCRYAGVQRAFAANVSPRAGCLASPPAVLAKCVQRATFVAGALHIALLCQLVTSPRCCHHGLLACTLQASNPFLFSDKPLFPVVLTLSPSPSPSITAGLRKPASGIPIVYVIVAGVGGVLVTSLLGVGIWYCKCRVGAATPAAQRKVRFRFLACEMIPNKSYNDVSAVVEFVLDMLQLWCVCACAMSCSGRLLQPRVRTVRMLQKDREQQAQQRTRCTCSRA